MPLVNDAALDPTNVTYDMAVDGYVDHASATVAVGKKYIAKNALYPDGTGITTLATGSLALCVATSPETWVALHAPAGMRLADSSTGIIWLRTGVTNDWNAVEAWLDIVADPSSSDVSTQLNALITTVAAVSPAIPIYLGPTTLPGGVPQGWKIQRQINNAANNPMICLGPIIWYTDSVTTPDTCAVRIGNNTGIVTNYGTLQSVYWVIFSPPVPPAPAPYTPDYTLMLTGVEFMNVGGTFALVRTWFFRMGFNMIGDGTHGDNGSLANHIELETYGCLKNVGWTCQNGASFVNENTFYYGDATHNDTTYTADSVAMLAISAGTGGGEFNGNKWYAGPGFEASPVAGVDFNFIELSATSTTKGTGVIANEFHGMRIDTSLNPTFLYFNTPLVTLTGLPSITMTDNLFNFGYVRYGYWPSFDGTGAGWRQAATAAALNTFGLPALDPTGLRFDPKSVLSFGRSNVVSRLSGSTEMVQAPARGKFFNHTAGTYANEAAGALTSSSIRLPNNGMMMGALLDLRSTPLAFLNKLLIKVDLKNNTAAGRIGVIGYQSDGVTPITSADDLQFTGFMVFSSPAWIEPGDMTATVSELELAWSANVAYLFIGVLGGTNTLDFIKTEVFVPADNGVVAMLDSMNIGAMGAGLPLIDDDLPYAVGVPCDPQGATITGVSVSGTAVTVTTAAAHGFSVGDRVYINGAGGIGGLNAIALVVTSVPSSTTFIVTATVSGTYTSGGIASYNFIPRGQTVRAWLPTGASASPREWVRTQTGTAADTWTVVNF